METIINLGIPHVGELIFESIDTPGLIECALVSETLKILAESVVLKKGGKAAGYLKLVKWLRKNCEIALGQ